jgi:TonB family protein
MNKNLSFIAFLLIAVFACAAAAQTDNKAFWSRIENDDKSFSVAIPKGFQIFSDKKGYDLTTAEALRKGNFNNVKFSDIRYITASTGDASFYIIRHKTNNLKDGFRVLSGLNDKDAKITTATIGNFAVKVVDFSTDQLFRQQIFIGYKDEIYEIFGGARNNAKENLKYLFASIKFNGEKPFVAATALDGKIDEQTVSLAALADTPFTVEEESKENLPDKPTPTPPPPGVTPIQLLVKKRAQYTQQARQKGTTGRIVLRVTFAASGSIEKISVIEGLPNGLTEQAVRAARMIRFLPEQKDGVPVTVTRAVEYSFMIY